MRVDSDTVKTYLECANVRPQKQAPPEDPVSPEEEAQVLRYFSDTSLDTATIFLKQLHPASRSAVDSSQDFKRWKSYLDKEMNLCLFGAGSMMKVMEDFVAQEYPSTMQMRIKGYLSSVKVENICMRLVQTLEAFADFSTRPEVERVLNMKKTKSSLTIDLINKLLHSLKAYGLQLVVLFFCLDGKNFRDAESHSILSRIFSNKAVRVIACMSNSNLPYLMSKDIWINYNFSFYQVFTYDFYEVEMQHDEISWYNKKPIKETAAVKAIIVSLTEKQKAVLDFLSEMCLLNSDNEASREDLLQACADNLLLTGDSELKQLLKEPMEQKIVFEGYNEQKKQRLLKMPNASEVRMALGQEDPLEEELVFQAAGTEPAGADPN